MNRRHTLPHQRPGIILLVVISSLAFFSILIATYLVYSRDARQSSFILASRNYRSPDIKDLLDESLMMLVRGTDDPTSAFYGEDLLSDYYGRRDALDLHVAPQNMINGGSFRHIGGGYVRFPVQWGTPSRPINDQRDDLYTGRLITFTAGPLNNRTFRVIRSRVVQNTATPPEAIDVIYIQLDPAVVPSSVALGGDQEQVVTALQPLFYPGALTATGYAIHMNGVPRNSPGIGFNSTTGMVNQMIGPLLPPMGGGQRLGISDLAVALQPNQIRGIDSIDKSAFMGDYDEDYDAADFNNWFLSYRNPDGTIVPSFHRPAVINYILNQQADWSTATSNEYRQALASISRATFRPLPIAAGQFGNVLGINNQFTGSSTKYALRTPLFTTAVLPTSADPGVAAQRRLDQLARALIADATDPRNQWDVDNTGDGTKDSIWVDIDLPVFTSPEGKLLKPLVAPRIEDLSARLNVNAHGNVTSTTDVAALQSELANWAGTRHNFADNTNLRQVFRGLGYGPAEIAIPGVSASGTLTVAMQTALGSIITDRYASHYGVSVPGRPGGDPLDVLRTGPRPSLMTAGGGYGYSIDPFGRGGVAMGRSGHLVAAVSGTQIAAGTPADRVNEALNDPYETDPSGSLGGDSTYSFAELEPLLRASDFDIELLPQRLRGRLVTLLEQHPEFAHVFTSHSKSDDTPVDATLIDASMPSGSAYVKLLQRISAAGGSGLNAAQINQLVAPELRLGHKLDVNRPIGNGVDDTPLAAVYGYGVIDEPREIYPGVLLPSTPGAPLPNVTAAMAPGTNGVVGSAFVVQPGPQEQQPFAVSPGSDQIVPNAFQGLGVRSRYNIVQQADEDVFNPAAPASVYPFDIERNSIGAVPGGSTGQPLGRQLTGRQLMARHLYVLMMLLTRDYEFPTMAETFDPPLATPATHDPAFFKARRIAQWAVNVVDYRDSDSIMTRFVFDPNPFDGWSPPAENDPDLARHVVWGVEAPELMFSESLALHDVRVRDTNRDASGKAMDDTIDPDPNTDQVRKPEGSLFLELYCPRPQVIGNPEQSTKPGTHRELYNIDIASGITELVLDRSAPPRSGNPADPGAPVWRIAISERHDIGSDKEDANPQRLRESFGNSYSFDPQRPDELMPAPPMADQLQYDRYIWFGHFDDPAQIQNVITVNAIRGNGPTLMQPHEVFFAPNDDVRESKAINAMRQLQPGQYLAIAPREVTHLGSRMAGTVYPSQPSSQRFVVTTGQGIVQFDQADARLTPLLSPTAHYFGALPLIVGAFPPVGANAWEVEAFEDGFIGLNVSEPLANAYYPAPAIFRRLNGTAAPAGDPFPLTDAYLDYTDAALSARDIPVDVDPAYGFNRIPFFNADAGSEEPLLGTVPEYCTAFLQRLADPTIPYDPVFNPYRTIDTITIDLTVFSGEEEPDTVNPGQGAGAIYAHRSRQRNGHIGATQANVLFSNETNDITTELTAIAPSATQDFFSFTLPNNHLFSSLSFLNTATPTPAGGTPPTAEQGRSNPLPFVGYSPSIGS